MKMLKYIKYEEKTLVDITSYNYFREGCLPLEVFSTNRELEKGLKDLAFAKQLKIFLLGSNKHTYFKKK